MKKILLFLLPILILGIGYVSFRYLLKTKPKTESVQVTEPSWLVATQPIMPTTSSPTVTLYGRVESPRTATLRAPNFSLVANVEVEELIIREGEQVSQGERLIRLENHESQLNIKQRAADIAEIKAQIELEKQDHANNLLAIKHEETLLQLTQKGLTRVRQLNQQRVSSQSAIDEAQQAVEQQMLTVVRRRYQITSHQTRLAQLEAKLSRASAQYDLAQLELERTQIKAPFSGIIAQVFIAVGDRVRSGDSLVSLYDNNALEVRAQIPSRYQGIVTNALKNRQGLTAHARLNQQTILLQLDRLAGQIDNNSGGIDGLFHLTQEANLLRLGQFLTLVLQLTPQTQVVALPFEAVYGTNRIYKFVEGRMQGLTVERVGEQVTTDGKTKILVRSPTLQSGDQVIMTQLPNAMEGLKVRTN
jgi:HlyD family secretion protein